MKTTDKKFVDVIRKQIKILQDDDYGYETINFYIAGDSEAFSFNYEDEFEINEKEGLLIVRDNPDKNDNNGVPEYVISLDNVAATELTCE